VAANPTFVPFASALFDGMRGMGRLWQAAATVASVLRPGLLEKAVAAGLRSLFIGFETLHAGNLRDQHKGQNLGHDYGAAIRRLQDLGVMVNGSFVFGLDGLMHSNWDLYDTRHVVYRPAQMTAETLQAGYWRAYHDFYRWPAIWQGAATKATLRARLRHLAYAGGWKKFEPFWDCAIRLRRAGNLLPLPEAILAGFGDYSPTARRALSAIIETGQS
jgi:hypothetical protein